MYSGVITNQEDTMHTIATRTLATTVALALVGGLASGVLVTLALTTQAPAPAPVTPACATEDSTSCYWDATTQGNGQGESFYVDAQGNTYRIPSACGPQDSLTARTLANYDVALDLWASGAEYTPEFRSDNLDVLIYQADNLACN